MTTNNYSTKRIVTNNGVHMGFVVVDEHKEQVCIPYTNHKAYTDKVFFAFARCNDAIMCNLGNKFFSFMSYADAEIGTRYQLQDF